MRSFTRAAVAYSLIIILLILPVSSFPQTTVNKQPKHSFLAESSEGLLMARLVTPEGIVRMYLPDEMAGGDTISGTVTVEPKGATDAEKALNSDVLNGYVFDLGDGTKVKADEPRFTWVPKVTQPSTQAKYVLKVVEVLAKTGETVASNNISILTVPPPVPTNINFPALGQNGHPVQITGPFDGNSANTKANIGGEPVSVIAESPRKSIVRAPARMAGPYSITAIDGVKVGSGEIRIVGVNLSAAKLNLAKGEKTTLTVNITGLQGLSTPVAVQIVTTGSVNMQGGNTQTLGITPGNVGAPGVFIQTYDLTAIQAGGFSVIATVLTGGPPGK